jgi:hypothetical protein
METTDQAVLNNLEAELSSCTLQEPQKDSNTFKNHFYRVLGKITWGLEYTKESIKAERRLFNHIQSKARIWVEDSSYPPFEPNSPLRRLQLYNEAVAIQGWLKLAKEAALPTCSHQENCIEEEYNNSSKLLDDAKRRLS